MDKLKVLIVDDEFLIRNLLKKRIDWEAQGMTIIGEASNAYEALDLVDKLKPDIIFTDICMPSVDGIQFSGLVFEKYPEIKIVIVTGHEEFDFARKSIKLGIADFILKPISAPELLSVTAKLRKKIYEERTRKNEFEKLQEEFKKSLPLLKEKFLNRWILQELHENELQQKKSYFNITLGNSEQAFQIAVFEASPASSEHTEEESILISMECRKKADSYFSSRPDTVTFSDNKDQIVIIADGAETSFVNECELLRASLAKANKCVVCVGISSIHKKLSEVHLGYQEACRALNYKAIVGKNQVVCYSDISEQQEHNYRSNTELKEKLLLNISAGSAENAVAALRNIFCTPFSEAKQLRLAAMDIISTCLYAATEQQIDDDSLISTEKLTGILLSDNLPDLLKELENYVFSLSNAINTKNKIKAGSLIDRVKLYLEKELADPNLGLTSTAAAFFVSPGHLGRLMKKETGQTFVEYLTSLRLKKAETLLKTTELKSYQVGDMVGISDPHYFSILFKKNTGKSVNEYRNATKSNV